MKKITIVMALALFTAAGVSAQDNVRAEKTPAERAKAQTERIAKELELTPEQAVKVEAINLKYAEQAEALHKERQAKRAAGEQVERDGTGKEMMSSHEADLKGVLTAAQFEKWKSYQTAVQEKRLEKRQQVRGAEKR